MIAPSAHIGSGLFRRLVEASLLRVAALLQLYLFLPDACRFNHGLALRLWSQQITLKSLAHAQSGQLPLMVHRLTSAHGERRKSRCHAAI